ncbi:MAG: septation protein SpoVG family protein [Acidimicrobiales bacterium]
MASIAMLAASRGDPIVMGYGLGLSVLTVIPHELLHAAAARLLGLQAKVRWSALMPHSQSEGVLRLRQVPVTSLAPQVLTLGLAVSAILTRSPVLAVAAIGHATVSVGDYAHAAYSAVASLLPKTRGRLLLNGTGPEAGLYEPIREAERQHAPKEVVPTERYKAAQAEAPEGRHVMQFRIYPDRWKMSLGPEPMLGPIEAEDARSAYHEAKDRGMYPAGVTFGLQTVALDEYGQLAPERGVWGGTQETPEWAAAHEPDPEKEALPPMKVEARNMKLLDNRTDNLLAVCDLNLGGDYVVQGVRVLKSSKDGKAFVSLPSYQDRNGDYHEVAHPVTAKAREVTNQVVLKEFERQVLDKLPKTADGPER